MSENDHKHSYLYALPAEVLVYLLTFLPPKDLIRCRQVCLRWKQVIDSLAGSDKLWRSHCMRDYANVCEVSRSKCRRDLDWYHIYRSLSLWPRLNFAKEVKDEFASASTVIDEIRNFCVLSNGVVGVHKRRGIIYYNIETLQPCKCRDIAGNYLHYFEDDRTIVVMSYFSHLYVIRKMIMSPTYEANTTFDNVKYFLLIERDVYYVDLKNDIYVCHLNNDNLTSTHVTRCAQGIICLGYKDGHLQLLTPHRNIYTVIDSKLVLASALESAPNLLHELKKYNLIDNVEWRVIFNWMFILNRNIPQGPLSDTLIIRTYGDMVFVGTNYGVFLIYHAPVWEDFDLFSMQPIKQYNFMERRDCPVLSMCPVIQIDVIETEHGHTVLVAMPKKIAIIDFVHNFKRSASVAMLPYQDVEKVKMLKINEM